MKSSRNLDSSEETEVNVQSAKVVIDLLQVIAGDKGLICRKMQIGTTLVSMCI